MLPLESSIEPILESIADGLLIIDNVGQPVHWNAVAFRILGGIDAADGKAWIRRAVFFRADEVTALAAEDRPLMRALRGELTDNVEFAIRNGEQFTHVTSSARPLLDESGQIQGAVAIFRDITERRRIEGSLRESERLYRALAGHLPSTAVLMFDREMRYLLAEGPALASIGLDRAGVEGRSVHDLAIPSLIPVYERTLAGETTALDAERDGRSFRVHFSPVRDERGSVFAGLTVAQDVTEQRAASEQLRRVEERLRSTFEHAPIGMAITGLDGKWIKVNRALCDIVGYSEAELLARSFREISHPDDLEADTQLVNDLLVGKLARGTSTKRYVRKDGTVRDVRLNVSLLRTAEGAPQHFIAQMEDLTDLKRLEGRILVSDRMASLGTLAAGVAHEVNNPLSYVTTNLELIAGHLRQQSTKLPTLVAAELDQLLHDAREGADRVRRIIRGLHSFSRAEDLEAKPHDVRRLLQLALEMTKSELRHRAIVEERFDAVPLVDADEPRLIQVFVSLLLNAAQAIPEGGVRENRVTLSTRTGANGEAVIEISDTGCGIDPKTVTRIFEPFFTTKQIGASGLGLAIAHGIVEQAGGTISVESVLGKGSTFTIALPASRTAPIASIEPGAGPRSIRPVARRRILIVDDEPAIGRAMQRALGNEHDVTTLTSAREAWALLRSESFDFILCDLMMPDMTGMDLHTKIAAECPEIAERFIFISGGAFTDRGRRFLDSVPNPRLDKPVQMQTLRALLRGAGS